MRTVYDPKTERTIHIKCGGQVINGTCIACGKKDSKGLSGFFHLDEPWVYPESDGGSTNRREHRQRLRSRRDIDMNFKERPPRDIGKAFQ